MGKLRSGIDNVVKTTGTLEKAANTLLESRTKEIDNFMHMTDMCRGGAESIYMYLMEKFKKDGKKIDANQKATLKEVIDANVATMVKEMASSQAKVVQMIAARDKNQKIGQGLKDNVAKARGDLKTIQGVIDKKKKKWLTSSKYKAKLKGYESAVADLDESLAVLDKMLPGKTFGKLVNPDDWKFSTGTTVEQIKSAMSTYFNQDLKLTKDEDEQNAKAFRGRGFQKSLATMKSWVDEADEMESEK